MILRARLAHAFQDIELDSLKESTKNPQKTACEDFTMSVSLRLDTVMGSENPDFSIGNGPDPFLLDAKHGG